MRSALRLLAPAGALSRSVLPRVFVSAPLSSSARLNLTASRGFASASHAGAAFDSAVNDLPYADFLRVPESDVLLDARHTKRQVDSCVRGLKEYGVTPGSNVALLVVPSAEFTLLQLAIIKLGATAVCIDPCAAAPVIEQVLSKHNISALFVSLDAPTGGASAADTLKAVLPELQATNIVEGKHLRYKGFPSLKFVAHTGDETKPHGVWRVRDLVWGDNLGDKGVPSVAPPSAQAPCVVFVDSKGSVTSSVGHDAVSSAIAAWLKRADSSSESKTFGPHGVAGDSGSFFKAFYGGK